MFEIMFFLSTAITLVMFIVVFARIIKEWNNNNKSPRLTVDATVVAKRENVSEDHHHHEDGHVHTTYSTTYYVTFQVHSTDRMELVVSGSEYGMMVEGDYGRLSFQGTRFLGFERTR